MANEFHAVGRRKSAVARVRLVAGEGKILINGRDIDEYFGYETLKKKGVEDERNNGDDKKSD